tara:strand:- start:3297 stop:4001 length:705 start_codon:yes stop_codon:yes gene_type:complete
MKLISYKLIINFIFNNLLIGEIQKPVNLYSIQSIKKLYLDKNIYYDFYNELCSTYMSCDYKDECLLDTNLFKFYNKYSSLTVEHIFPQSFIKEYKNSTLDMHNIYLTNSITNSHRSNYKYIDENIYNKYYNNEKLYIVCEDNFKNTKSKIYIPCINIRGPIARSIAYMKYTYPNLNIENVITYDLIIKWNILYPPTQLEIERNEIIKSIQGNYNPFISNYNKSKYLMKSIIYFL